MATSSPYTRAVVAAMRKLYPEDLADKSFDNTGLLLEAPYDPTKRQNNSVILTVDLTKAVADEAIERKDSVVIAYHPIIFRGLKSLTLKDTQQQTLLRLAAKGISVYSPHTAVDCAAGGLGDWLADIVTGTPTNPDDVADAEDTSSNKDSASHESKSSSDDPFTAKRPTYRLQHHPSQLSLAPDSLHLGKSEHTRYPIQSSPFASDYPGAGMGRIVRFEKPIALTSIIDRIGLGLGNPKGFPIAVPQGKMISDMMIGSVGICAGSGGHLFGSMKEDVDLYFTGEMSHHEALAAIEQGKCVICLFHSNTERGFLHSVLKGQLDHTIAVEWKRIQKEEAAKRGISRDTKEALKDDGTEVYVSEIDRDPYGIMISKEEV
ncbi:NIF3 NGG1 interactin-like proteing factor 3-like 1 [Polychaeton citri CBS 116435]|uniref:NIF3 NGG1 interactin-like proteing factor 3-like 1 n=1 Tax=Polychaeton citri CBS 116435 TaxID=1314669 RepID=A0A9P4UTJ6_9PEZI|nr:NIF3 NGG1 interactin-like proteing factor 3-like 1 [Polychaeton citri CBS 116435]